MLDIGTTASPKQWLSLLAVSLGVFLYSLNIHMVNIALPTLVDDLHSDFTSIEWIPLSYSLMLSVLVLVAARLGDMWSKKGLYLISLGVFGVGSVVCSLTNSVFLLIVARAVQGIGAVFMAVLPPAMVADIFPREKLGFALGILTSIGFGAASLGPTVGGLLLTLWGWRAVFWVSLPICLVSWILVVWAVPQDKGKTAEMHFDVLGALLLSTTLICFLVGLTRIQQELLDGLTVVLLIIAVMSFIEFILSQKQSTQPLLNLELFQSTGLNMSLALSLISYAFTSSVVFIIPFFLHLVKHYPEAQIGLCIAVLPALGIGIGPIAGFLADRFDEKIIRAFGLVLLVLGCWALSTFDTNLTVLGYFLRVIPIGIGFGLFQPPNQSLIVGSVPPQYLSVASGLLFFSRSLGQVLGLTLIGLLFSRLTTSYMQFEKPLSVARAPVEALVFGEQISFRIILIILTVAALISGILWQAQAQKDPIHP